MSMTESEALEWFKGFYNGDCERNDFEDTICADCNFPCRHGEPILRAISALEKLQKIKALGDCYIIPKNSTWEVNGIDIHKALEEIQRYRAIGTVSEFRELKEKDEDLRLKYCYEDLSNAEHRGYLQGSNEALEEFANFLHEKAKENNGLRLSSETRSWTHPSVFDYLEEFKNEKICEEED